MKFENVEIELLEESDSVNIYSIKKEGETYTEFEKFLLNNKNVDSTGIAIIMARIEKIKDEGCFEHHFRYAGKKRDRTFSLPSHFDVGKLRVYCIVLSKQIIILGNGGVKTTRTYNEDPWLNKCAEDMKETDFSIKKNEKLKRIKIASKTISGELTLKIKSHESE